MKMKKMMVSLMSLLLVVLTLSSALVVGAAGETPQMSTVTLINKASETAVSLENKTYEYYKIFDVVVSGNNVTHTVEADFTGYFTGTKKNALGVDVTFMGADETGYDFQVSEYINTFKDENKMTALVTSLRKHVLDSGIAADYTSTGMVATTTTDDKVIESVSTEVAYGYYLILDSAHDVNGTNEIVAPGMLVDVVEDVVTWYTKASTPVLDKYIWHDDKDSTGEAEEAGEWDVVGDHQTGQTIHYKVSSTVPTDYTGYDNNYKYVITTTKAQGVDYNHDLKVYSHDTADKTTKEFNESNLLFDGTYEGNEDKFTKNDEGFMEYEDGRFKVEYAIDDDGNVLTDDYRLTVDVIGLRKDKTHLQDDSIYLSYSGVANDKLGTTEGDESDETTLEYSNNPYDPTSTGTYDEIVYHHVFDITIFKTANDTVTPLAGAVFSLSRTDNNVETQIYLVKDEEQTIDGVTIYHTTTQPGASDTKGVITTESTGKFLIYGLNDAVKYTITEVKAPEGFNKVKPMDFLITATYDSTGAILKTLDTDNSAITAVDDNSLETTIVNTSKTLLPSTGGMGTTVFMILGATMMIGAGVLLLVMKRKEKHN